MAVDRTTSSSTAEANRPAASSWACCASSYSVFSMEKPRADEAWRTRPSSSTQLSTETPPKSSAIRHAGMESHEAGSHRPPGARTTESGTTRVSCSSTRTSTRRVDRVVGSNTGKSTAAPTSNWPAMATRMGTTAEKTGGVGRRKSSVCSEPWDRMVTVSRESPATSPSASNRPTSESSEKENRSMKREGSSFTKVRATAVPVCPSAGSSSAMRSSNSNPSATVSRAEVAWPTARSPMRRV
jgi:hypothetical protein